MSPMGPRVIYSDRAFPVEIMAAVPRHHGETPGQQAEVYLRVSAPVECSRLELMHLLQRMYRELWKEMPAEERGGL